MASTRVQVRTVDQMSTAVGWAGSRTLTIDRTLESGGHGLGYNGGELLLLAVGACYTNDIFREAAKLGITVRAVSVTVQCDWGGDPVRAQNLRFSPVVEADADPERIQELIEHTDRVAEIHNSLRFGTEVTLDQPRAVRSNEPRA